MNTNRRWRIGLLGAGFICEAHARALAHRRDVELAAVCDRSTSRAQAAAARFAIPRSFSRLEDLLDVELDAVHVLLPANQHVEATRRILESGRHAFVEKPMALAAADCRALAALALERGRRLGVNHNFLFLPSFERLRRDAARGVLGKLDQVSIAWRYPFGVLHSGPFDHWALDAPGNLMLEVGPHLVAFALDLMGGFDDLQASASRPLDLADGRRIYRHWHVRASRGDTTADLVFSAMPGAVERSIVVRGQAALARCDIERDLYCLETPSGQPLQLDNFLAAAGMAWQLGANATRNLLAASNPFADSVARSIGRFYDSLVGQADRRLDAAFGAEVVAACERIAASVPAPSAPARQVAVAPPRRAPTVLVLGGTGFIGRHLVRSLAARGVGIRVATRSRAAARVALDGLPVELVEVDLPDAALDGIEVVYDLAKAEPQAVRDIAERAMAKGVKRFIYTGTIDSYYSGNPADAITADTPLDPKIAARNAYARSKAACEALLMALYRDHGFPAVIFRPGIVIGSGCAPAHWGVGRFWAEGRMQFWGDGRHPLPLVLVEDVAQALVLALDKPGIEGHAFLLTGEPLLSGRDYVQALCAASGAPLHAEATPIWKFYLHDLLKEAVKHLIRHPNRRRPSYRDWDSRSHRARYDNSKAKEVLGWRPAATREALIERGVVPAVREFAR